MKDGSRVIANERKWESLDLWNEGGEDVVKGQGLRGKVKEKERRKGTW